jgi:hypothetical protein
MEQHAQILFIYLAMARVGEVRFENYSDWDWHDALQVVNTWWTELKKLENYSMPMVPDYESYTKDLLLIMLMVISNLVPLKSCHCIVTMQHL